LVRDCAFTILEIFLLTARLLAGTARLRQGLTIGNRVASGPVPVIEDDVEFGAYAQVLGDVRIDHRAKIAAMSVVLCDVPAGATAVGVPARVLLKALVKQENARNDKAG
jgi:serine O-acetyltransferase